MVFSGAENRVAARANLSGGPPWRRSEIVCFIRVSALYLTGGRFYLTCRHFYLTCRLFYLTGADQARKTRDYNGFQPGPCGHRDSSDIAECPSGNPSVTHPATSRNTTFSTGFPYYSTFLRIPLTTHHMYMHIHMHIHKHIQIHIHVHVIT